MNYAARLSSLSVVLLACAASFAQSHNNPQVVTVFAVLSTPVDTKTSARGDEVLMTTVNELVVDGKVIIAKGSKIVGHIGGAVSKGKDEPKSAVAIAIDKAIGNGADQPLQAIIAAVAAPPRRPGGGSSSNPSESPSDSSSSRTVNAARIERPNDQPFVLTEDSQGTNGYEDLAISWHLTTPPPLTIFATKAKRLRLEPGTQIVLRMLPPSAP